MKNQESQVREALVGDENLGSVARGLKEAKGKEVKVLIDVALEESDQGLKGCDNPNMTDEEYWKGIQRGAKILNGTKNIISSVEEEPEPGQE